MRGVKFINGVQWVGHKKKERLQTGAAPKKSPAAPHSSPPSPPRATTESLYSAY